MDDDGDSLKRERPDTGQSDQGVDRLKAARIDDAPNAGQDAAEVDVDTASASTPAPSSRANSPKKKHVAAKSKLQSGASTPKAAPKKSSKPKSKSKIQDLKASSKRSASVSSAVSVASPGTRDASEEREQLFCLCRKKFDEDDEEGVMVGCDSCDNWFHPSCIGMTEEEVDRLDAYVCGACEKITNQRTSFRKVCNRSNCDNSVIGRASKYCSSTCALQHMSGQVPLTTNKKLIKQLTATFSALQKPPPPTTSTHHLPPQAKTTEGANDAKTELQSSIEAVQIAIAIVRKRQAILQKVITDCEALAPVQVNGTAAGSKKKTSRANTEDRPCGWSTRLVLTDVGVEQSEDDGSSAQEEGSTCLQPRRRCDRHQGWQKTSAVLLDIELAQSERQRELLESQAQSARRSAEKQAATSLARRNVVELLSKHSVKSL